MTSHITQLQDTSKAYKCNVAASHCTETEGTLKFLGTSYLKPATAKAPLLAKQDVLQNKNFFNRLKRLR